MRKSALVVMSLISVPMFNAQAVDSLDELIQGKDFQIDDRSVSVKSNQSSYEIRNEENSKVNIFEKDINDIREYLLRVERDTPSTNGRVKRITEVKEDKVTFGEGVWHGLGGSYGNKYTTAITATFDNEGHLTSRTFCQGSRNSYQLALNAKCRTITYNRCRKAFELNQRMQQVEELAAQCKSLGNELSELYQDKEDLVFIKENLDHLSEHSKVKEASKDIEVKKPSRVSEIEYRLPDLGYTIKLCEEYGKFFRNIAVHPAPNSTEANSEDAE